MPRRNRNTKGVQLKPHAGYPNASLEGLPSEVKLEIVKLIGDLPSLRRLRLASQEYYAVVRAYAGYLKPFYPGELTLRLYRNIGRTVTTFEHRRAAWSEEFDRALIHALRDWDAKVSPYAASHHNPDYVYTMPGEKSFRFKRDKYVAFRMYVTTGEQFDTREISKHVQVIENQVLERLDDARLREGDLQLLQAVGMEAMAHDCAETRNQLNAIQGAKAVARSQGWPADIQKMPCELVYNMVERSIAVAFVSAGCQLKPDLALAIYRSWQTNEDCVGVYGDSFLKLMRTLRAADLPLVLHKKKREYVDLTLSDASSNTGQEEE